MRSLLLETSATSGPTSRVGLGDLLATRGRSGMMPEVWTERGRIRPGEDAAGERHYQGVAALLKLFARKTSRQEYLDSVVRLLRSWCGCSCAGIRLVKKNGSFPYSAQVGFARNFLREEQKLTVPNGVCACGRILGRQLAAQDLAYISLGGSFFCNQASRHAARLSVRGKGIKPIPCLAAGYESLAHAPIRYHGVLLGTLHLADKRPAKFPQETIAFVEAVTPLIGEAIHRFRVEQDLLESEGRFRSLFEGHRAGMILVEPRSGEIVDANQAAAQFYGYSRRELRRMKIQDLDPLPSLSRRGNLANWRFAGRGPFALSHKLATGEERIVEVYGSEICLKQEPLLFLIIHDVTERKQLEKRVLDACQQERERVGRDLHDSLGGKLAGLALIGKALAQRLAGKCAADCELAEEIVECLNQCIGQTRLLAHGLCPAGLRITGLVNSLAEFAAETQRQRGVRCRFHVGKRVRIKDRFVALHLFRIVQEAVSNALRHGEASRISIGLSKTGKQLCLTIRDNGTGLPAPAATKAGLGLQTMQYRAQVLNAQFAIKSRAGKGTVVSCHLPLVTAAAKE